jgi:hypothetical protein
LVGLAFLWLERSLWHGFNMPQAAEVTVRREKALDFGGGQNREMGCSRQLISNDTLKDCKLRVAQAFLDWQRLGVIAC